MDALHRAISELVNIESCCDEAIEDLERLESIIGDNNRLTRKIEALKVTLEALRQRAANCEDDIMEAQVTWEEPRAFELYPYPESLAELVAVESAVQNLGMNFWGVE